MNLNPVGVDDHGRTADVAHVKAGFALLDEVFHLTPLAVKADQVLRGGIHIGHNKGMHVEHLTVGLFNLAYYPPGIIPGAGFVQELSVYNRVRNSILLRQIVQSIRGRFSD